MINPMKKQGFSLIEIMVSLAIFAIVVVVATGALLTTIDATKKAQATQTVLTNLNLALEGMTREIRTGSDYVVSVDGKSISFLDKGGVTGVDYSFVEGISPEKGKIVKTEASVSERITAPEVDIKNLKFIKSLNNSDQPKVFITLKGMAGNIQKYKTDFEIQTTVSQRKLNRQ